MFVGAGDGAVDGDSVFCPRGVGAKMPPLESTCSKKGLNVASGVGAFVGTKVVGTAVGLDEGV